MYYETNFGRKRMSSSECIIETVLCMKLKCDLDLEDSNNNKTITFWLTNDLAVQKIFPKQTLILNLHFYPDLEHSNPVFSLETVAMMICIKLSLVARNH